MQKGEANGILIEIVTKLVEKEYLWLFTNDSPGRLQKKN
jgi:hypothetical protein